MADEPPGIVTSLCVSCWYRVALEKRNRKPFWRGTTPLRHSHLCSCAGLVPSAKSRSLRALRPSPIRGHYHPNSDLCQAECHSESRAVFMVRFMRKTPWNTPEHRRGGLDEIHHSRRYVPVPGDRARGGFVVAWMCGYGCPPEHLNKEIAIGPYPSSPAIRAIRWPDLLSVEAAGLTSCVCAAPPVEGTTWGRVKALYR